MAYTWSNLLESVKIRGAIPTSNNTYTEARFLLMANEVMRSEMVPFVNRIRENFWSTDVDFVLGTGNSNFMIPSRAVAAKFENVAFLNGTQRYDATRYFEEELLDLNYSPARKPGFYVKRNRIYVVPTDGGGWSTLRTTIIMRPNKLVAETSAAQITAIDTNTNEVTCESVPTTWTTASVLDIVQAEPHYDWRAIDQTISAIATGTNGTITFTSTLPTELAVGDWVSLAGESPVIQFPEDVHPLFSQKIANVLLRNQDMKLYEAGRADEKQMAKDALDLLNPRVEKEGKVVNNRSGMLRKRG